MVGLAGISLLKLGTMFAAAAGSADFKLELVTSGVKAGTKQLLEVRLLDSDGRAITGATFIRLRLDMAPDGMAQHTGLVIDKTSENVGRYIFDADLSMPGRWQLSIAARAPNVPETIMSKVIFKVEK